MIPPATEALQRALLKLGPQDKEYLLNSISQSDEAIIFGSFAYGCETSESDLDVLLIGSGRRRKSKHLDLLWLPCSNLNLKTWLGSELASHIATYGLWLKGNGSWKSKAEITKTTINKKKLKILYALSHLYIKRPDLSINSRLQILSKILLDIFRLSYLVKKIAVPPTLVVRNKIASYDPQNLDSLVHDLLGDVGTVLINNSLHNLELNQLWYQILHEQNM